MEYSYPKQDLSQHPLWTEGAQAGSLVEKRDDVEIREAERLRWLHRSNGAVESVMNLDFKSQLILPHSKAMSLFRLFNHSPTTALNLGLGGGDLVRHLMARLPSVCITSVDNDENIVGFHERYFLGPESQGQKKSKNNIIIADANEFVQTQNRDPHYDVILVDLFNDGGLCPFVLSASFLQACFSLLSKNGFLVLNLMLNKQDQLQTIAQDLHRLSGAVPLLLSVPKHPNIVAFASSNLSPQLSSRKLLAAANRLDEENTSNLGFGFGFGFGFAKNFTQKMIEDNRSRFKEN